MNLRRLGEDKVVLFQMTPMIDCVFLLLIYFMSVTTFQPEESELAVGLPAEAVREVLKEFPLEIAIAISVTGQITIDGAKYDDASSRNLPQLVTKLKAVSSNLKQQEPKVIIRAHVDVTHERVVDVLNACAEADMVDVSFPMD